MRESLAKIEASGTPGNVVVIGGGYAGVELAAVVAEKLRKTSGRVTLVTDLNEILATSPDLQRAAAKDVLAETGVEVRAGGKLYQTTSVIKYIGLSRSLPPKMPKALFNFWFCLVGGIDNLDCRTVLYVLC